MNAILDVNSDNDFLSAEWFDNTDQVFSCMSKMIKTGWDVTAQGLMSYDEIGFIVARPIKIKGKLNYTGVGLWRISDYDVI